MLETGTMQTGKVIIFSAPSGAGKTTIVRHLLSLGLNFGFSVSATSRKARGSEVNGVDYYFLSEEEFKARIANEEFLEWQEVYTGTYYGSLKSEVSKILDSGKNILFDVDVVGGSNIKAFYGARALAIFVEPPTLEELEKRLLARSTDDPAIIAARMDKAAKELTYARYFDKVLVNDKLDKALHEAEDLVRKFLS